MPKPFRRPASDDEEIPDYAKEVSSLSGGSGENEEGIPSYAKEVKKPEKSFFSKAVDAIKPSKSFKATRSLIPSKVNEIPKEKGPDLEQRKDSNAVGFDQDKWSNIASKFPESWHGIPVRYPAAFIGSLAGTAIENLSAPENIAAMGAGTLKGEVPRVRQSREIPYKMESPTVKDINLPTAAKKVEEKAPEEAVKPIEIPGKGVKNPFEKKATTEVSPERSPNLRSEFFPPEDLAVSGKKSPIVTEDSRYTPEDLAEARKETARLMKADIPRLKDSLPRGGGEVPDYAKEISAKPDVTEGFGGSGHPESPDYTSKVLSGAGKGEPGLAVEEKEGFKHVVYRDKDGSPIAVAKVVTGPDGKSLVHDLAADKTKGLLTGRAMQGIGNKLNELGATESSGTMSADAENFMGRMKGFLEKKNKASQFAEEVKPTATFKYEGPEGKMYDVKGGPSDRSTVSEATLRKQGIDVPTSPKETIKQTGAQLREKALAERDVRIPELVSEGAPPIRQKTGDFFIDDKNRMEDAALSRRADPAQRAADRAKIDEWNKTQENIRNAKPMDMRQTPEEIAGSEADWNKSRRESVETGGPGGMGAMRAGGPFDATTKKLLNALIEQKGVNPEQQALYKAERAKRFAAFEGSEGEGIDWAKKAMSTLKGEYEKVNPGEGLGLSEEETGTLFTAVKRAAITTGEKARGIAALFKLMNGETNLQKNEIELLDKIFEEHLGAASGPGAATPYDIKSGGKPINFSEAISKTPDDFLTKLANFSTKTTRMVLGFHVPGTAISFHGFNEAIRNTMFGPDFNPFKAAGRFGQASYYLAKPGKAAEFLEANSSNLQRAMEEGGLKASTGDIGTASMFKGENILTKGINALTSPKPLFGQVIPALKLKGYEGLLESLEKKGMPHAQAAKAAGEATNNIFGGLNLQELERNRNTQKLFRIAALAPDWLESNVRLGKGMFSAIKNPGAPESKVYLSGMMNFLGSYVALNVINAINNNGRFSFQNEVGHEFDIATGKDSAGRTRYFSPYGTAMDMVRIPLEIAHSAVEGNMGKAFSDMRSRASEPIQFMTDMMTNTDYAGRSLYDKTKYGKPIPPMTQGLNVAGDAASHFLPIGAEAGINLAQGKVSPEQFASQVLQLPMKYKTPQRPAGGFKLGKMKP